MCPSFCLSTTVDSLEWMEEEITNQSVVGRVKLESKKMEQILGRQPKLIMIFRFLEVLKLVLRQEKLNDLT